MQPAAGPAQNSCNNKPFFITKLRMAVRFSKPVRQWWLKSIKRFQLEYNVSAVKTQLRTKPAALPLGWRQKSHFCPAQREKSLEGFSGSQFPESSRN
ncbi:hypothetical protein PoB_001726300 [Plakobranchus ocellatus]|uniref:Uncharacterized protein n=1 Tax=Plakobranchus ocellatus TaxID=259542 RepID=A0AAV3Z8I1_9GAST|nr:hypothetical protein PoB_001726300 [Plakobranchus ocellatus]